MRLLHKDSLSWLIAIAFALLVGPWSFLRVTSGALSLFDLAVYHTALLNTFHDRFYYTYMYPIGCLLHQHFDPLLLPMALPFYALLGNSAWTVLLLFQLIAAALVFPALGRIGRDEGLPAPWTLAVPLLLFFNPALHNVIWYDFHPVVLAMPFLVWGWAFQREKHRWAGHACWFAAMLCKENVPLTVAALGIVLAIMGQRRRGLAWFGAGIAGFIVITGVLIPSFRDIGTGNIYLVMYGWLGESPGEIARTLLTRPLWVLQTVWANPSTEIWLRKMLLPLGLLFLLAPQFLLALLPELAIMFLSTFEVMHSILYHYPALSLCVLSIASVTGLARLHRWASFYKVQETSAAPLRHMASVAWRLRAAPCLFALLISLYYLNTDGRTWPFLQMPRKFHYYKSEERRPQIQQMAALIPRNASISIPGNLLHPLSPFIEYQLIALYPDRAELADYLIIDLRAKIWFYYDTLFGEGIYKDLETSFEHLSRDSQYERIYQSEDFYVFKRRQPLDQENSAKKQRWIINGRTGP